MIRPAVPEDIFQLAKLGQAFFKEAGFADKLPNGDDLTFDLESFGRTVGTLIDTGGVMLVAEIDENVVGMAAAGAAPAWWNNNVLTAQELFWYVDPPYRKGIGAKLMMALEAAVKSLGVTLFSMSAEEGLRSTALNRMYRQRGYFPTEMLFWKRLGSAVQ